MRRRTLPRRALHRLLIAAALTTAFGPAAVAQPAAAADAYPSKPIRLVVPYPPGAANDTLGRALAQRLALVLGQPIVVENRPGAGGHLGAEQVARSPADGYTLLIGTSGLIAIGPHIFKKLTYDPQRDLVPITRFATVPYVFGVPATLGLRGAPDLAALAKKTPGGLNYASSGNGSVPHLCGELFNLRAGVKMIHVPYKGGAQAMNDVASGQVQLYCGGIPSLLPHVKAGRIKLVGVTSPNRSPLLPDEPTLAEQGIKGVEVNSWVGLLAPAGTPAAIVQRLAAETARIMAANDMKQYTLSQGAEPEALNPAEFAADIKAESDRWADVVKASGAKID
ncbi:MAG: Bug family tripartite tricarboxylate transporter substrate binding protein [Burkholderiaceae bacterium]